MCVVIRIKAVFYKKFVTCTFILWFEFSAYQQFDNNNGIINREKKKLGKHFFG